MVSPACGTISAWITFRRSDHHSSAGMKPSTLYPHWLALSKALAYLWALRRRADPQAPAPEALHFAMQQKMIARRNRATDARANRETPIEVIAHSRLHSLSHSLYPNLLHYSRPLTYCRIVSQDLKSDARWLSQSNRKPTLMHAST